ncbi:MAG: nitroreductase family protein [Methylomonas sp.]|nr:nitroreductase family protein [Methylomonas sp.]PPD21052.1 MAG: nitroreductase [Methylomonas sp.]PPD27078.1 MAG: nitroreductase [Methylomonas sp.]PPD39010.1 MAG: nitroreductase [Methylomonas sp.]PPD40869.1 MAG: nitroreductase [Methylomonas sp.]
MLSKPATTAIQLHDIIQNRWSPRAFDPSKPIADDDLTALLEAARWAPSCFNDQPWRFVVCVKHNDDAAWNALLACLAEKNQLWARHAPVLILAVAMRDFGHNGQPNRWSAYDTGAASMGLCLQATALGLIVHQMGGFDADACRLALNLPADCTPMSVLAVGHQAEADTLDDRFRAGETGPRQRAALTERFHFGRWPD